MGNAGALRCGDAKAVSGRDVSAAPLRALSAQPHPADEATALGTSGLGVPWDVAELFVGEVQAQAVATEVLSERRQVDAAPHDL